MSTEQMYGLYMMNALCSHVHSSFPSLPLYSWIFPPIETAGIFVRIIAMKWVGITY